MLLETRVARPDLLSHQFRTLVLKCDACDIMFEHAYKKIYAEKQRHFCNRKCANQGKKINPDVPRIRQLTCSVCQKSFEVACNTNQIDPKTCSRSCASSLVANTHNLVASMQTPEVRARAMKTRSAHWRDGTVVHGRKGKRFPCSSETREKLREKNSGKNNGFYGKKHTEKSKQKMCDARSKLITDGKMNWALFGHKSGQHQSSKLNKFVHYRSSWEEMTMHWLDSNVDVLTWEYESVRIPYRYDDHKRWYIPDFIITYVDGHREMWEIKPKEFVGTEKVRLKTEAAQLFCQQNSITAYVVMSKRELHLQGIL